MNVNKPLALFAALFALGTGFLSAGALADTPGDHPAYLHALSDLRGARWMIDHRPGDWAQSEDERFAVQQIDTAIAELKQASFDDGKNLNDHPPIDERPDHPGRLHAAMDFLHRARSDIEREEDNRYARGLRNRSIHHIDDAIHAVGRTLHE